MEDYGFLIFCAAILLGGWGLSRLIRREQRTRSYSTAYSSENDHGGAPYT